LVPLALAEVLALLPPAAQHWDTLQRARQRLADTPAQAELGADEIRQRALEAAEVELCGGPGEAAEVDWRGAPGEVGRGVLPDVAEVRRRGGSVESRVGSRVVLRGADLGWPGGPVVLRDVDLDLAPGTYAAVVGPSGAGKSTLVAALLGFLAPRRGVVAVPDRVAWAPQEPMLAGTTVAENLRLAQPTATADDLRAALRQAALADLDPATLLGSGGSGLSGGQAQRVALARALLGAPSAGLVLLDEPTAHLDEATAQVVRTQMREALAGRTVVHVTHRAEEADGADVVLEVRDGRVVTRVPVS
jgi:ATP-binding cassette subfamily C protein CydD/ATP-binding cassette subfamily C protein CydCD